MPTERSSSSASDSTICRSRSSSPRRERVISRRSSCSRACRSASICCKGGRDADPRQATLRATIDWSYDLLDQREQEALRAPVGVRRRLHCSRRRRRSPDADLDVLASLVDKSLVRRTGERYWMLETIREFASGVLGHVDDAETLAQAPRGVLARSRRHARLHRRSDRGGSDAATRRRPCRAQQRARGDRLGARRRPCAGASARDDARELLGLLQPIRGEPDVRRARRTRWRSCRRSSLALATRCRGNLAIFTGDVERGLQLYEDSLSQYERLGDEHAQAILEHRLGVNLFGVGERQRGQALLESSLERSQALGFRINEGMVRGTLGMAEYREGNVERGLEMVLESVELAREAGFRWWEVNNLNALAACMLELDRLAESEGYSRQAISVATVMGDRRHIVQSLAMLAAVAARVGRTRRAGVLWGAIETEERRGPLGHRPRMALWEHEREKFGPIVLANPGPELERRPESRAHPHARSGSGRGAGVHRLTCALAPPRDLREWIALLEREGELRRISAEVDPDLEITEIVDRVVKSGGPALLFENPKGSQHPLLINQFGTEQRMCMAFGVEKLDDAAAKLGDILDMQPPRGASREGPRAPEAEVGRGLAAEDRSRRRACQEVVLRGRRRRSRAAADPALLAGRPGAVHHAPGGHHEGPEHGHPQRRHVPDAGDRPLARPSCTGRCTRTGAPICSPPRTAAFRSRSRSGSTP